ncbi:DUF4062 domain-containing protein [Muricoccus aerilatus]|uniref:DUF4062 domain-containing protein n=1 Tax=Muricoccus aerilatus TaxID=452982 RepID=UPI0005C1F716|nr:DUF4062 domain-containing protein [Roseomonas aerilata]
MKVFVSSLITGHEDLRAAAIPAIRALRHEVILAEDFPAMATSPRVACLDSVRAAGAVVLILTERYGAKQASGLSATHEEFRTSKDTRPIFAFVREPTLGPREPDQEAFIREVQEWVEGRITKRFTEADDLRELVTGALHSWELNRAETAADPAELLSRATALLPRQDRQYHYYGISVATAIAGGPRKSVLRPSELEAAALSDRLQQMALFGPLKFLTPTQATTSRLDGSVLSISQERGGSLAVDELGGVRVTIHLEPEGRGGMQALIEEDVVGAIQKGLRFGSAVLDEIDPTQALRHIVPVISLIGASYQPWMRREEFRRLSGGMSMRGGSDVLPPIHLTPPERLRAALTQDLAVLVEDLTTLLKRAYQPSR